VYVAHWPSQCIAETDSVDEIIIGIYTTLHIVISR